MTKLCIAALAILAAVPAGFAQPTQEAPLPGPVGSWFGRATPFNPPCEPGTAGCPIPAEIVMLPTFYADGNFIGIDSNVFVGYHSTAHGNWVNGDSDTIEANFVWLQSGETITSFVGAFRVRLVGKMVETDRNQMTGFIQAYFFPFVDPATQRVVLDNNDRPVPDPLGQALPDGCTPQQGCLGTFNFTLRRIAVDRAPGAPAPGLASFTAQPNPIVVTDGSGLGATRISWIAPTAKQVEVRIGAPDGPLFAAGGAIGSAETQKWVRNGVTFYLQDVTNGKTLISAHTLGKVTVRVESR
ncbi:MAG: hypothetical protein IPM24_20725 [Bryobacterales bacterium]|nr:hypothetical protein [Bryobacterales bacterium]